MRRFLFPVCGCLAAWFACAAPAQLSAAETLTPAERKQQAAKLVEEALRQESYAQDAGREELLKSALQKLPEFSPAMWHTGHVLIDKQWVKFDEVPAQQAEDHRLAEYEAKRKAAGNDIDNQLELANWCRNKGLDEQQRAHLTRVVEQDTNHAEARARLGFRRVDGVWMSSDELVESAERRRQATRDLAVWQPKLIRIRNLLASSSKEKRDSGIEQLLAIGDPAAIPALEMMLSPLSEEVALLVVQAVARMPVNDASVSLARHAVFSPFEAVRDEAVEKLKSRKFESFVPQLLSGMYSPLESRWQLFMEPTGRLTLRQMFYREGHTEREVAIFDTSYALRGEATAADFVGDALITSQRFAAATARQEEFTRQLNKRICEVLASVVGDYEQAWPEIWWTWWNDYNEVYATGDKPILERYQSEEVTIGTGGGGPQSCDCLAAGTLVWTASGQQPIEQIQVGDLVLSQDVDTGELAYKPVLRTTIRPASVLVKVVADDEQIEASGGHPFWIAGKGWVRARDLKADAPLHAVDGSRLVGSVERTRKAETYNLIVADFHTYFVGKSMVLSHDNSIAAPTDATVPGLLVGK